MSALIVDGDVVHYEVLGRGRPLIFVHGWLGSWRYWVPTLQALSGEYRAYALDLWGFGDTAKRSSGYGLDAQADLLRVFMDRLAVAKAALVGHGLGALVVAEFCRRYPELADRAVLTSLPIAPSALTTRLLTGDTSAKLALLEGFVDKGPHLEPIKREAAKADPLAIDFSLQALKVMEVGNALTELNQPLLLVYGGRDTLVSAPADDTLAALSNNIHSIDLDASRHFPMLDEAARFNRLLADFFALKPGSDVRSLALKEEWVRRVR
jgi:pimeloyl-ACP methyl ester carboxylesterase